MCDRTVFYKSTYVSVAIVILYQLLDNHSEGVWESHLKHDVIAFILLLA